MLRAVVVIHAAGLRRHPVARPSLERDDEGVLDGLLGAVEVAERPRQDGDRLPGLAPEQAVDECPGSAQAQAVVDSVPGCS